MKPPKLNKGDTIGIVSPARWLEEKSLVKTVRLLEKAGYKVKVGSAARLRENQYAGTTEDRVKELEEMFSDKEVKAIICSRGGYGAIRVTDMIDYDLIRRNPKIFVGYSDITALHSAILKSTGLTTFHGPMLISFVDTKDEFTWKHLFEVISSNAPSEMIFPKDQQPKVLRQGNAEGQLFGGNLTLLINMIGTRFDFNTEEKILFIEDTDEKLYSIDRLLLHLKRSGKLGRIAGLIVGEVTKLSDEEIPFGKSLDEIVLDVCRDTQFPIISNFPCGHGEHQMTMPYNIMTQMLCTKNRVSFTFLESAII